MALPLAQLTVLVGAGIAGSVLAAKEGAASTASDFLSGAAKILWRQIRNDSSTSTVKKPPNDALVAQVNNLRQELQLLSSNQPVTIVTTNGTGSSKYGVVIVIVVVGYGYIWWKGWKLPDMMFATRRSLSDACDSVSRKLENVYSSIAATKQRLSSQIDKVDSSLDNVARIATDTKDQVSELLGQAESMVSEVDKVRDVVKTLEVKFGRMEFLLDDTNSGVKTLCGFAASVENGGFNNRTQALPSNSSGPTIELLPSTPSPRVEPSRPDSGLFLEAPSPSESSSSHKGNQSPQSATTSSSGLKVVQSDTHPSEDTINGSSRSGLFGMNFGASLFSRTRSATNSFKFTNNAL